MNCLIVANLQKPVAQELDLYLRTHAVDTTVIDDPVRAVQCAQEQHFDAIVLDARAHGLKIEQTIRLLKGCDPHARIIVRTDDNSRHLEGRVRKEQIFYYHLDSFGMQDLQLALSTALGMASEQESNK